MKRLGELRQYDPKWSLRKKVNWVLDIDTTQKRMPYYPQIKTLQKCLSRLNVYEISLQRNRKRRLSLVSRTSIFDSRHLKQTENEMTVFGFIIENVDQVASFLDRLEVTWSGNGYRLRHSLNEHSFRASTKNIEAFLKLIHPTLEKEASNRRELREARKALTTAENLQISSEEKSPPEVGEQSGWFNQITHPIRDALAKVASFVRKKGVDFAKNRFEREAERHRRRAFWWLIASALGAIAIISVGVYFYFCDAPHIWIDVGTIDWNNLIPKISSLAILILFELMIISTYRAERHNETVNEHRSNALATFDTMTSSSQNRKTIDTITLIAASAIYSPQDTGFSRRTGLQQTNISEIFGNLIDKKSS